MLIDRVEVYSRRGHKYLFSVPCFSSTETITQVLTSIVTSTPFVAAAKRYTTGHPTRDKFIFHIVDKIFELKDPYVIFIPTTFTYKIKSYKTLESII